MTGKNTTVWKFPLLLAEEQTVDVPLGAMALCVQMQGDVPCLWVFVDPTAAPAPRRVLMVGTGHTVEELEGAGYLGTVQMRGFVWHYFDGGVIE